MEDGEEKTTPFVGSKKPSLLAALSDKTPISRCLVVGLIAESSSKVEAGEAMVAAASAPTASEREAAASSKRGVGADAAAMTSQVHGLCLVQNSTVACLYECPEDTMSAVLKKLDELSKDGKVVKSMRVISCCEGTPARVFGKLTSKILTLQKEPDVDLEAENPTTAAFYVYTKLVKLGRQLTSQASTDADMEAALGRLKQYYAEFLPSNERIAAMAGAEAYASVEQHYALFCLPLENPPLIHY